LSNTKSLSSKPSKEKLTSEADLVELLQKFLEDQRYVTEIEVPNMGQYTDIVAERNKKLLFIEAKTHDWKRGLSQCIAHETVADFICLAVGMVNIPDLLRETIKDKGYGLIHCDPYSKECSWELRPKKNKKIWDPQRRVFISHLRNITNED
jgi:hypothetical protein